MVSQGTPVFILADATFMKVVFGVSVRALPELKVNTPVAVFAEALSRAAFDGRVTRTSPSTDPASRIFEIEMKIPNPEDQLKAGMIASVLAEPARAAQNTQVILLSGIVRPKAGSTE